MDGIDSRFDMSRVGEWITATFVSAPCSRHDTDNFTARWFRFPRLVDIALSTTPKDRREIRATSRVLSKSGTRMSAVLNFRGWSANHTSGRSSAGLAPCYFLDKPTYRSP